MSFEAVVVSQNKNSFTVRQQTNNAVYNNVLLASLVLWNPTPGAYVLCDMAESGQVYIVGKIQGECDDKFGYVIGDESDRLVITENGTLYHTKETNETIIDADGLRAKYVQFEVEGLGWKIKCEDAKVTITLDPLQGQVFIDSPLIKLAGDSAGGIPTGNDYMTMINEIKTVLNSFISMFNAHIHPASSGTTSPTASQQTTTVTGSPKQSIKVKSS